MDTRQNPGNSKSREANIVRAFLQELLRKKLKTRENKEELARHLELSQSAVESMIYQGQGGLDRWVGAILFCYRIKEHSLPSFISQFKTLLFARGEEQKSDIDLRWASLQSELNPDEKLFWLQMIESAKKSGCKIILPVEIDSKERSHESEST